ERSRSTHGATSGVNSLFQRQTFAAAVFDELPQIPCQVVEGSVSRCKLKFREAICLAFTSDPDPPMARVTLTILHDLRRDGAGIAGAGSDIGQVPGFGIFSPAVAVTQLKIIASHFACSDCVNSRLMPPPARPIRAGRDLLFHNELSLWNFVRWASLVWSVAYF